MKKTVLILAVLLFFAGTANVFSIGIGGAFGLPLGDLPGSDVLLSLKLEQSPFLFGVGGTIGQDQFQLGLIADYWMFQEPLVNFIGVYAGPGLFLGIGNNLQAGVRVPVGLQIFPLDFLELFIEFAPTVSASFGNAITFPEFGVQGAFGFRFWFNT